jgi:hypothetical protein
MNDKFEDHKQLSVNRADNSGESLLANAYSGLTQEEISELRKKAAEAKLKIDLERAAINDRLQSSSLDLDTFINNARKLDANHSSLSSSYRMEGTFSTASGETKITSKKGCFIATSVYGSYNHPNVVILRKFRDDVLSKTIVGICFCEFYYLLSPYFVNYFTSNGLFTAETRRALDAFCDFIEKRME